MCMIISNLVVNCFNSVCYLECNYTKAHLVRDASWPEGGEKTLKQSLKKLGVKCVNLG